MQWLRVDDVAAATTAAAATAAATTAVATTSTANTQATTPMCLKLQFLTALEYRLEACCSKLHFDAREPNWCFEP